jgi:diguanylate cyclase (GGDEF)-like protein
VYGDFNSIEKGETMVSTAVTNSTMVLFSGSGYNDDKAVKKLAITYIDPFQESYYKIYYPDARIVECDSIKACLEAVAAGTADFTIIETAKVDEYDEINNRRLIQKLDLHEFIDIGFAVKRSDKELLSILNKGIVICDDSIISNSLIRNSQKSRDFSVSEFIRIHIVEVIICIVAVFVVIIGILTFHYVSMLKSKKQISEAYTQIKSVRHEASHDDLTGLLNRGTFHEMCIDLKKSDKPLALLMMDVDKFKSVNDDYGHQTGDRALQRVANVLKGSFRTEDYVIRYAGDEFVVIMPGMTYDNKDDILAMVDRVNDTLQIHTDGLPTLSVSVGVAFSEKGYNDDIFEQADIALYKTKKNGRCGCSVFEAVG